VASESKTLNDLRAPFVAITASGICEGGRVLHHLFHGIPNGVMALNTAGGTARATMHIGNLQSTPDRHAGESFDLNEVHD